MNIDLKSDLEKYKKTRRNVPFPMSTQDFISAILKPIPNQPDIVIDATLLRFILLFPDFIPEFIAKMDFYMQTIAMQHGGVVFHLYLKDVTLANVHKYGMPLIQTYNHMLDQGRIQDCSEAVKTICCYFSSDVIRSILKLIQPLLNPHIIEVIRVFSRSESADYFSIVKRQLGDDAGIP
jgi:hypothetical protein